MTFISTVVFKDDPSVSAHLTAGLYKGSWSVEVNSLYSVKWKSKTQLVWRNDKNEKQEHEGAATNKANKRSLQLRYVMFPFRGQMNGFRVSLSEEFSKLPMRAFLFTCRLSKRQRAMKCNQ